MKRAATAVPLIIAGCGDEICLTHPDPQAIQVVAVSSEDGSSVVDGLAGTVQDGSYVEQMSISDGNKLGWWGRAGTYDVRVEASGFEDWVEEGVRVRRGDCHLITRRLTAEMTPE